MLYATQCLRDPDKIQLHPTGSYPYALMYTYRGEVVFLRIKLGSVEAESADPVQGCSRAQNKEELRCCRGGGRESQRVSSTS